jgi:DNA-directed RNA polymerase III subunit RPC5
MSTTTESEEHAEHAIADVVASKPRASAVASSSNATTAAVLPVTTSSSRMDIDDSDDEEEQDTKLPARATLVGGNDDDDEEEDEDEIVQEIPVYLSPSLSHNLRLIQYPLQRRPTPAAGHAAAAASSKASSQLAEPSEVRIKSRHYMMEVDFATPNSIDCQGNYSMSRRTYSSHTIPISTHMALGKIKRSNHHNGGQASSSLHLVPLSGIVQLRPNFDHVDQESAREEADEALLDHEHNNGGPDRKPVGFQKKESERAALARKSSYAFKRSSEESEVWQLLKIHNATSQPAQDLLQQVTTVGGHHHHATTNRVQPRLFHNTKSSTSGASLNERYVNSLNYLPPPPKAPPAAADHRQPLPSSYAPIAQLNGGHVQAESTDDHTCNNVNDDDDTTHLVAKLVRLMQSGSPMPFSVIRSQFVAAPASVSDETLLQALGSCAIMVRGNFCLSSRLLGMPPNMAQARTFVLFVLQSMGVVHRARLEQVFATEGATATTNNEGGNNGNAMRNGRNSAAAASTVNPNSTVTPAMLEVILHQVARHDPRMGWVLKVEEDASFGERHPEVLLQHVQHWATLMEHHFAPWLGRYRA